MHVLSHYSNLSAGGKGFRRFPVMPKLFLVNNNVSLNLANNKC